MKTIIQIILLAAVVFLGFKTFQIFETPLEFEAARTTRQAEVVERLKDIRTVQRAYLKQTGKFAGSFDELVNYYNNDSMMIVKIIGDVNDSVAVAEGRIEEITTYIKISDTLLNDKGADFTINDLKYIPYSDNATGALVEFAMDTATVEVGGLTRSVFEAKANYVQFLGDLDKQELINFRDEQINTLKRDDFIRVGSLETANNEAGNWEE